jgi:hypothetical protein
MDTLWTFGDSMTEPFQNNNAHWSLEYCNYKGYCPKVYGEILADKLNMNLVNKGLGGIDNYTILERICEVADKIKEDDIVIVGWTSPIRFRIVNDDNAWSHILPNYKRNQYTQSISQSTTDEIIVNRDNILFIKEINNWIKLINKSFKNTIHWSYAFNSIDGIYLPNFNRIVTETNGVCNDTHYSETGHIQLSDTLYELITSKKNKKII